MYFEQTLSFPKKSKYFKIFFKYKLSISNSQEIVLNIQLIISRIKPEKKQIFKIGTGTTSHKNSRLKSRYHFPILSKISAVVRCN
jgi:hypothetical protein